MIIIGGFVIIFMSIKHLSHITWGWIVPLILYIPIKNLIKHAKEWIGLIVTDRTKLYQKARIILTYLSAGSSGDVDITLSLLSVSTVTSATGCSAGNSEINYTWKSEYYHVYMYLLNRVFFTVCNLWFCVRTRHQKHDTRNTQC